MINRIALFVTTFFLTISAFSAPAFAAEFRSCTREHLQEAIVINNERKPLYAKISNGQSLEISESLVGMEHDLLKMALFSDIASYFYQKSGVPLLCDEYVSMSLTPAFAEKSLLPWPNARAFALTNLPEMIAKIQKPLANNDYPGVSAAAKEWLQILAQTPGLHCLERHFVESIGRAAALALAQNKLSTEKLGLGSLWVSKLFIKSHFDLLKMAQTLDTKAAPLQAQGIAIICQDIPPIAIPTF